MINYLFGAIGVSMSAGCSVVALAQQQPPQSRAVVATISATSTEGGTIPDVPLRRAEPLLPSAGLQGGLVLLSQAGAGSMSVSCKTTEPSFGVSLSGKIDPADPRTASLGNAENHFNGLVSRYAFLQFYSVPLVETATTVSLPLMIRPASALEVRIKEDGFRRSGPSPVMHAVGYVGNSKVVGAGKYELAGVPLGVAYDVSILDGTRLEFVQVASHTARFVLPDVVVSTADQTISLNATLLRPQGTPNAQGKVDSLIAITLLRTDGTGGYQFFRGDFVTMPGPDRLKQFAGGGPETGWKPNIKPGEYWVLPRPWANLPKEIAFRQMVMAGRNVDAAGLPKIIAVAGQPLNVTLDGDQMTATFDAFTKPLVEAALPVLGPNPPSYVPPAP
jgi:hypothetical protein